MQLSYKSLLIATMGVTLLLAESVFAIKSPISITYGLKASLSQNTDSVLNWGYRTDDPNCHASPMNGILNKHDKNYMGIGCYNSYSGLGYINFDLGDKQVAQVTINSATCSTSMAASGYVVTAIPNYSWWRDEDKCDITIAAG